MVALRILAQGVFVRASARHPTPDLSAIFTHALVLLYRMLVGIQGRARGLLPPAAPDQPACWLPSLPGDMFGATRWPLLAGDAIDPSYLRDAFVCLTRADSAAHNGCVHRGRDSRWFGRLYEYVLGYRLERCSPSSGWDVALVAHRHTRRATGSFYTPDDIVQTMVAQTLGPLLQTAVDGLRNPDERMAAVLATRVLDPAMGSGLFLLEATDYLTRFLVEQCAGSAPPPTAEVAALRCRVAQSCIYGVELDPLALDIARLSLWLATAPPDSDGFCFDQHLCEGDALVGVDWGRTFSAVMAGDRPGFSAVLGNPPYLRQEVFAPMKPALARAFPELYHGSADLSTYFIGLGVRLLRRGGRMSYITSGTFRKLRSGAPLRRYLSSHTTLLELVDIADQRLFRHTVTYPIIMTLVKAPPSPQATVCLRHRPSSPATPATRHPVPTGDAPWLFPHPSLRHLFEGWEGAQQLGDRLDGPVYRGITTGCNRAFVINRATYESLVRADPSSADVLKPVVRGEDLRPWFFLDETPHWLICIPRGADIGAYPAIQYWLTQFRPALEPRPPGWERTRPWPGRSGGSYQWYELQSALTYQHVFEAPHLQSNKVTCRPAFSLAPAAMYATNTAYVLPFPDEASAFYMLGLLHSRVCAYYCRLVFSAKACGYYEVQPAGLARFPVPDARPDERAALVTLARTMRERVQECYRFCRAARQDMLSRLAPSGGRLNRSLSAWWDLDMDSFVAAVGRLCKGSLVRFGRADWEAWEAWLTQHQRQYAWYTTEIARLEHRLNAQVYALFAVGPAEQRHIEQQLAR